MEPGPKTEIGFLENTDVTQKGATRPTEGEVIYFFFLLVFLAAFLVVAFFFFAMALFPPFRKQM